MKRVAEGIWQRYLLSIVRGQSMGGSKENEFKFVEGGQVHTKGDANCAGCTRDWPQLHNSGVAADVTPKEAAKCKGLVHAEESGNLEKGGTAIEYFCDACGERPF
jgi:hypothetical protein